MLELICSRLGVTVSDLQGGKVDWNRDKSKAVWSVAHEVVGFSEGQLKNALHNYKSRTSRTYRPEFEAGLRVIAPQWFSHDSDGKKAELLAMALRGEPRPVAHGKNKHPLGQALCIYTNRKNKSYDPVFDKEIRALRPDWFVSRSDKVAQNKLELKAMALRGEPRPASDGKNRHPLGVVLCQYTDRKNKTYDPVFDREIRALRPDWFVSRSEKADLNKLELLAMALRGEPRPAADRKNRHPLGVVLCQYTNPSSNCYDPVFDQEIRALRPDWFTCSDKHRKTRAAKKKEQACLATS